MNADQLVLYGHAPERKNFCEPNDPNGTRRSTYKKRQRNVEVNFDQEGLFDYVCNAHKRKEAEKRQREKKLIADEKQEKIERRRERNKLRRQAVQNISAKLAERENTYLKKSLEELRIEAAKVGLLAKKEEEDVHNSNVAGINDKADSNKVEQKSLVGLDGNQVKATIKVHNSTASLTNSLSDGDIRRVAIEKLERQLQKKSEIESKPVIKSSKAKSRFSSKQAHKIHKRR